MKSPDASLISAKMFLNAAQPSSLELPAGTMIVLRFLLTEASDTCAKELKFDSYNSIIETSSITQSRNVKINGRSKYIQIEKKMNKNVIEFDKWKRT